MDNQHRPREGYRELDQTTIDLINEIAKKGREMEALVAKVGNYVAIQGEQLRAQAGVVYRHPHITPEPQRWLELARTDFQVGLMKLTRAVAQPGAV